MASVACGLAPENEETDRARSDRQTEKQIDLLRKKDAEKERYS